MIPAAVKLLTVRSVGAAALLASALRGRPAAATAEPRAPRIVRTSARSVFEENRGQTDSSVAFLGRGRTYVSFFLPGEIVLALPEGRTRSREGIHLVFRDARADAAIVGGDALPGRSNYFLGGDPARWVVRVPQYSGVAYRGLYPGIDLACHGMEGELEHDFILSPGADPAAIRVQIRGARKIRHDDAGDLILSTPAGDLVARAPVAYQEKGGVRSPVDAAYVVRTRRARPGTFEVGFRLGTYDRSEPLVIDPVLSYSTYLGGTGGDYGTAIAVDRSGFAYVTGQSFSADFPKTTGQGNQGSGDVFVTKLAQDGETVVYSTFLGGKGIEMGNGIAVDAAGNAYVSGQTASADFPTTAGAYRTSLPGSGGKAFVTKLDPTGSLAYSTLVGVMYPGGFSSANTQLGVAVAVDGSGSAYLAGSTSSPDFPTTPGAFQTTLGSPPPNGGIYASDAFVTKLNPAGTDLVYSTYLGGIGDDAGNGIAVDKDGNAYVAGMAGTGGNNQTDFPTTPGAFQTEAGRFGQGTFVAKLNPSGTDLVYATLVKGQTTESQNWPWGIAIDEGRNVYVTGQTTPRFTGADDFPTTPGAPQPNFGGGNSDAFAFKLNPTGSGLVYSTFLGGTGFEDIYGGGAIAVDRDGNAYVAGSTASPNFPSPNTLQTFKGGGFTGDAFVAKLNPAGTTLLYATFLGGTMDENGSGIAVDPVGNAYVAGSTYSTDFPATPGAYQTTRKALPNAFVSKIGELTSFGLSAIVPNVGGNTGTAAVVVEGGGFQPGVAVRLEKSGQADVIGDPVGVAADGRSLDTVFDLHGVAAGTWDVVVTNPGGATATLANAFTVQAGIGPAVWVDVVGQRYLRGGQVQRYNIVVGNRGDAAALGVPLWIRIPKYLSYKIDFAVTPPALPSDLAPFDFSQIPIQLQTDTETILPLFVAVIPAGSAYTLPIELTVPDDPQYAHAQFDIVASVGEPLLGSPLKPNAETCLTKIVQVIASRAIEILLKKLIPIECAKDTAAAVKEIVENTVGAVMKAQSGSFTPEDGVKSFTQMLAPAMKSSIACANDAAGYLFPELKIIGVILELIPAIVDLIDVIEECGPVFDPKNGFAFPAMVITSGDPNDKLGSIGAGDAGHSLTGSEPLRYLIQFTNEATATAPAQDVVVNDTLDPTKVNLATFAWGPIAFGATTIPAPLGSADFTRDVDLRPAQQLIARVTGHLNTGTGAITWHFASIDPVTDAPTTEADAGFLPPDGAPPEGEGSVSFSVSPKALPTGTVISNQAHIKFDVNPVIDTAVWTNTIDASKPSSHVLAMPASEASAAFTIQWTGTDTGSGIAAYGIFVSGDGGPFSPFLLGTTDTSAIFTGEPGHSYAFYSIARDQAGNVEDPPAAPDASTTVSAAAAVADLSIASSLGGGVDPGTNVTLTLTLANAGPAAASNLSVTQVLPAATTYVSASQVTGPAFLCTHPAVGATGTFQCTLASLASGASAELSLVVKIAPATPDGTLLSFLATAASGTPDANPENNAALAFTTVGAVLSQAADALVVDPSAGAHSDGDGVLEPGETVKVQPAWRNLTGAALALTGAASGATGPTGATYSMPDASAGYGSIPIGAAQSCTASAQCYSFAVSAPATRPAVHWDVQFTEAPSTAEETKVWTLHVGDSFTDVPRSQPFYRKIETLLHTGITAGCTPTTYCPGATVSRGQMAIFIAKSIAGGGANVPASGTVSGKAYNCKSGGVSLFTDVAPTDSFCKHVHYIASQGVTLGCSATTYCPNGSVSRLEMAAFIAKGTVAPLGGSAIPLTYGPDPVTGNAYSCDAGSPNLHFADVPVSSPFCKHVNYLWARGVIGGCTDTNYCPAGDVTRDSMAKFLTNAFGLTLYGP